MNECIYASIFIFIAPALACSVEFSNGSVSLQWSFSHTGGVDITALGVKYVIRKSGYFVGVFNGPLANEVLINFPSAANAGYAYKVIARNVAGATAVDCLHAESK